MQLITISTVSTEVWRWYFGSEEENHLALKQGYLAEFCRTVEMRMRAHNSVQFNRMKGNDKRVESTKLGRDQIMKGLEAYIKKLKVTLKSLDLTLR